MAVEYDLNKGVIKKLIDEAVFDGFSDLEHLNKKGLNIQRFLDLLRSNDRIEATPLPFSFVLVRAIHQAFHKQKSKINTITTDFFAEHVRFAVFAASHMVHAREVDVNAIQKGFYGVKMREDVKLTSLATKADKRKEITLMEWPNLAFYHVPQETLDPMWDLFDMSSSPFVRPNRFRTIGEDGYPQDTIAPILVGKARNRKIVEEHDAMKMAVPCFTMGYWGAAVHISVLLTPMIGDVPEMNLLPVITEETMLERPAAVGDVWVLLTYEPPTVMLDIQSRLGGLDGSMTVGEEEQYS